MNIHKDNADTVLHVYRVSLLLKGYSCPRIPQNLSFAETMALEFFWYCYNIEITKTKKHGINGPISIAVFHMSWNIFSYMEHLVKGLIGWGFR